jgi:hypothetical protein
MEHRDAERKRFLDKLEMTLGLRVHTPLHGALSKLQKSCPCFNVTMFHGGAQVRIKES